MYAKVINDSQENLFVVAQLQRQARILKTVHVALVNLCLFYSLMA